MNNRDTVLSTRFELTAQRTFRCLEPGCKTLIRSANADLLAKIAQVHAARAHGGSNS
ncbi:hypothetical protein [Streptomyces sp. NPDC048340]|uniref:hypothetical protein n=1 Tax=Streptomyces sp. NPDC048340 TaxID=3365537 RepID=UPI00371C2205